MNDSSNEEGTKEIADYEDWWEELLLHNPQFSDRIAKARQDLREGKGTSIEEIIAQQARAILFLDSDRTRGSATGCYFIFQ